MKRTNERTIGEILQDFFARPEIAAKVAEGRIPEVWREVVGDLAANQTTDLRLENHVLYARIQSSVVRQELFYRRNSIAAKLNQVLGVKLVNVLIVK